MSGLAPTGSEGIVMGRSSRQPEVVDTPAAEYSDRYLLDRLVAAGVGCLDDWCALSPRARRNIFGITVGMAKAIDQMAKARSK